MKFLKTVLVLLFVASFVLSACGGPAATEAVAEPAANEPVATDAPAKSARWIQTNGQGCGSCVPARRWNG